MITSFHNTYPSAEYAPGYMSLDMYSSPPGAIHLPRMCRAGLALTALKHPKTNSHLYTQTNALTHGRMVRVQTSGAQPCARPQSFLQSQRTRDSRGSGTQPNNKNAQIKHSHILFLEWYGELSGVDSLGIFRAHCCHKS